MRLKFNIGNVVNVPVKFTANDEGREVKLAVTLICKRLSADELKDRLETPDLPVKDFVVDVTTGWKGQTFLVDEETGAPAEFSKENLAHLLSFPNLDRIAFAAYLKEQAANVKN